MVGLYVDPEGKTIRTHGLSYTNGSFYTIEHTTSNQMSGDDAMKGLHLRITELERTLQQYKVNWLYIVCIAIIAILHHNKCKYNFSADNLTVQQNTVYTLSYPK